MSLCEYVHEISGAHQNQREHLFLDLEFQVFSSYQVWMLRTQLLHSKAVCILNCGGVFPATTSDFDTLLFGTLQTLNVLTW